MSCVGLCRGLIARNTFGLAIRTFAANSYRQKSRAESSQLGHFDSNGVSISAQLGRGSYDGRDALGILPISNSTIAPAEGQPAFESAGALERIAAGTKS